MNFIYLYQLIVLHVVRNNKLSGFPFRDTRIAKSRQQAPIVGRRNSNVDEIIVEAWTSVSLQRRGRECTSTELNTHLKTICIGCSIDTDIRALQQSVGEPMLEQGWKFGTLWWVISGGALTLLWFIVLSFHICPPSELARDRRVFPFSIWNGRSRFIVEDFIWGREENGRGGTLLILVWTWWSRGLFSFFSIRPGVVSFVLWVYF